MLYCSKFTDSLCVKLLKKFTRINAEIIYEMFHIMFKTRHARSLGNNLHELRENDCAKKSIKRFRLREK